MNSDWFNNTMAVTLLIGQIIVFLPQFIKIYRRGHSIGHHPLFMFMGHLASLLAWINALVYYIYSWNTCQGTEWECLANVYGLIFYFIQWLFWVFWYIIYLSFLGPEANDYPENDRWLFRIEEIHENYACRWQSERKMVYLGFLVSLLIGVLVLIKTLFLLQTYQIQNLSLTKLFFPEPLLNWSFFLEIITAILFAFCYLPQLYEVVRIAKASSYSLLSLVLMIPSNIIWIIFLANWSFLAQYQVTTLVPIDPALTNITKRFNQTRYFSNQTNSNQINSNQTTPNQMNLESSNGFNLWIPYVIMVSWQITILGFGIYYTYYHEFAHIFRIIKSRFISEPIV